METDGGDARFRSVLVLVLYTDIFMNKFTSLERTDAKRVTKNTATYMLTTNIMNRLRRSCLWQSGETVILNRRLGKLSNVREALLRAGKTFSHLQNAPKQSMDSSSNSW